MTSHSAIKKLITVVLPPFVTLSAVLGAVGDEPARQYLLSSRGCCAATAGTGNKIITHQGKTHVGWLDSTEEGFFDVVRTLDRKTGEWSPTYTLGKANGDHGRPAMTIDSKGYLHVVYGIHHNSVPYRRSLRPNDASEWTEETTFGGRLSYPTLVCGPDDTLLLSGRYGWDGVRLYAKPPRKPWEDRGLIIKGNDDCFSYAAYHEGLAWGPDHKTLHLSCSFFQGKSKESHNWGSIQSVNYMRSHDLGRTWERADGTPIELPATAETMDVLLAGEGLDPKPGIRNTGAIVVDSKGNPYVLYYRNTPEKPGQAFLATTDSAGKWWQLPLQAALDKHFPSWAIVDCRAGFTITADDRLCMALSLVPIDHPQADWTGHRAGHSNEPAYWQNFFSNAKRIHWLESNDGGQTFTTRTLIKDDPQVAQLQQSIEMPTGFNEIPPSSYPGLIYHTGVSSNREGMLIDNDVFFVHIE